MSIATLLLEEPTGGSPTGQGDWNLVVEILVPDPGSDAGQWGVGTWGTSVWSTLTWVDVTDSVRGMTWTRGSDEVFGRPRVGNIALTLEDRTGDFDPWTADAGTFYAPGTIMRAGLISPTGINDAVYGLRTWIPQWTGIVEMWAPEIVAAQLDGQGAADRYVEVYLSETLRDLAQTDELPVSPTQGAGENSLARFPRLLDAAQWRYGLLVAAQNVLAGGYPLQATDLANNRLAELYLTADSCDSQFRTLRDGRAGVTAPEYATANIDIDAFPLAMISWAYSTWRVPFVVFDREDSTEVTALSNVVSVAYRPETFHSMAQDTEISNDVIIAAVGGTPQRFQQLASVARFGRRSYVRSDFLNNEDATPQLLAQYTSVRRALATLRIEAITVDSWARPLEQFLAMIACEPGDKSTIRYPFGTDPRPYILGRLAQIVHRVTPAVAGARMMWETDVRVDTREVGNVPGAQLPSTQP
jgi:hypothetical protein